MYLLQKETGWSDEYILWGTSWVNLQMKLADAAHYHYGERRRTVVDEADLANFLEKTK